MSKPRKPTDQMPKIRAVVSLGAQRLFLRSRGDVKVLKALSAANGQWIDPRTAGIRGQTLSRHVAALRKTFRLPIETRTVQDGSHFFNAHRLPVQILIDGGSNA